MIGEKQINNEDRKIKISEIKRLLGEVERKLKEKIDLEQYKKLEKIEKILKGI
jgi:predicted phosphatase